MKIVKKPWGEERIFAHTDKYIGKILSIKAGKRLSKQYHKIKDETLYLLSGSVEVEITQEKYNYLLKLSKEPIRIEPGCIHRIIALENSEIVEVSTPELNDVVRLEDDFDRVKKIINYPQD
jgi:quercetin dioxygenase-like cupin family protein